MNQGEYWSRQAAQETQQMTQDQFLSLKAAVEAQTRLDYEKLRASYAEQSGGALGADRRTGPQVPPANPRSSVLDEIAARLQQVWIELQSTTRRLDEALVRATGSTALPPQQVAQAPVGNVPSTAACARILAEISDIEGWVQNLGAVAEKIEMLA